MSLFDFIRRFRRSGRLRRSASSCAPLRRGAHEGAASRHGRAASASSHARTAVHGSRVQSRHANHAAASNVFARIPALRYAMLVALIVVLVIIVRGVTTCTASFDGSFGASGPHHDADKAAYTDMRSSRHAGTYDWTHLYANGGRYTYEVDGVVKSRLGIDVSSYQGDVDWPSVASDGVSFAMLRVGYRDAATGDIVRDRAFSANLEGAQGAGLDAGVYFFSQATNEEEAREEAAFVLSELDGAALEYPVAFDSEVVAGSQRTSSLSNEEMTAIARAFCDEIAAAGYTPMIYGNETDMARYDLNALSGYGRWFAGYGVVPSASFDFALWQYTETGRVDGIEGNVDIDLDLTGAW